MEKSIEFVMKNGTTTNISDDLAVWILKRDLRFIRRHERVCVLCQETFDVLGFGFATTEVQLTFGNRSVGVHDPDVRLFVLGLADKEHVRVVRAVLAGDRK